VTSSREDKTLWVLGILVSVAVVVGVGYWAVAPRTVTTTTIGYEIYGPENPEAAQKMFRVIQRFAESRLEPPKPGKNFSGNQGSGCPPRSRPNCQAAGVLVAGGAINADRAREFLAATPTPDGYTADLVSVSTGTRSIWACPHC